MGVGPHLVFWSQTASGLLYINMLSCVVYAPIFILL